MGDKFKDGVWPVMLTPFTDNNQVDYDALGKLVDWYIENGVAGLFADCQSSEMFFLTLEDRVQIARFVKERADGRVSVVASGHISDSISGQAEELNAVAETGVDAVILLTNRLAETGESDEIWLENLKLLLAGLPKDLALGFYECPYPYKRIISPELLKWCADTGRFYFIKDTSCSIENIRRKLESIQGSRLKLFNANSSTLLETLRLGGSGFSGVMANFHADLYVWLCGHYQEEPEKARILADFLTITSMIERQVYPVNAKYYLNGEGVAMTTVTRTKKNTLLTETFRKEMEVLRRITGKLEEQYLRN